MRVFVVTPPEPVISLSEAKDHLRVRHNDEDALITAYVAAATGHIDGPDGWLGRAIGVQTLEAYLCAPTFDRIIHLPYPPAVEVESIEARTASGWDTVGPAVYEVRGSEVWRTASSSWPAWISDPEAVRVIYQAGYEIVPPAIRAAILLMVGDLYANRETVSAGQIATSIPMSTTVENLLSPFRVYA